MNTVTVNNETELDAAIAAGNSIVLNGTIDCARHKEIRKPFTTISGPGHLRFGAVGGEGRCLQAWVPDITLQDFEMSSTAPGTQCGINIVAVGAAHRLQMKRLHIHDFHTCIGQYGGNTTPHTEDTLIEDCYLHRFEWGTFLSFGVKRAVVKRTRMLGKQEGDTHAASGNAFYSAGNVEDLLIEDCLLGKCGLMGCEMTTPPETKNLRPRVIRTRIVDAGGFGVSFGHSVQGYAENLIVDGAHGIGIEIAGDDATGRTKDMLLVGCDVRNVTDPAGGATSGITIDKSNDVVLLGCRLSSITASKPNEASGVYVYMSDRVAVLNCIFMDGGAAMVHLYRGHGPNTGGFHVVEGCTFRDTVSLPNGRNAIYVSDINTIARNNTVFQRAGSSFTFAGGCTPGAAIYCDTDSPIAGGVFTGSNKVISVP